MQCLLPPTVCVPMIRAMKKQQILIDFVQLHDIKHSQSYVDATVNRVIFIEHQASNKAHGDAAEP